MPMGDSSSDRPAGRRNFKPKNGTKSRKNDHILRKRAVPNRGTVANGIYINTKSNFNALLAKCEKRLESNESELVICCMGRAVERGINLALKLCEKYPSYEYSANTATIELTDDLEPLHDDADYEVNQRQTSGLYVRIFRVKVDV